MMSVNREGTEQTLLLSVVQRTDTPFIFLTLCVYPAKALFAEQMAGCEPELDSHS